ncbi:MAG: 2-succinyl-5-enolpyruvyl-6-hydroxy-3-cyclohexene-1-carboxylic-acid synthase [Bacteroidales bacterium]|jgi:2-succinyl-5-enolpyruvyl-6-hydroxy-3-cyclohexene-1-carboxylate synthase
MLHQKQHITDLSEICFHKGIKYIVISPGSRNAPLTDAFYRRFGENCISIVDERSAGYFALGLARNSNSPVAIISTSGTAVLNFGPSLAEAYYQRIPLIAITADRPEELIDQQDNQTIRQKGVFHNFTKAFYHLPRHIGSGSLLTEVHAGIEQIIEAGLTGSKGPVHFNVPLSEPLYDDLPPTMYIPGKRSSAPDDTISPGSNEFFDRYRQAKRIMIIHGQDFRSSGTVLPLQSLSKKDGVVVIAENIANVAGGQIIDSPDLLLAHTGTENLIPPELVIYSGGQIVSKKLKTYIRGLNKTGCWRIGPDEYVIDTFQKSNAVIPHHPAAVYRALDQLSSGKSGKAFRESWLNAKRDAETRRTGILSEVPFSDLKVCHQVLEDIPSGSILELGNSSVIRYSQLFTADSNITYYSNRGVSGIDGCLSSAAGTACSTGKLTIAMLGDLSFVYDSNALWNRILPPNFRIIVINNSGGDVFSLIDGPSTKPGFERFFRACHPVHIQKLAEAFNLDYFCIEDEQQLKTVLPEFFMKRDKPLLMEVKTLSENNKASYDLVTGRSVSSFSNPE